MKTTYVEGDVVTVFLTTKCNQKCIICPQEIGGYVVSFFSLVAELKSVEWNAIHSVYITGGEPLLFQELIKMALSLIPLKIDVFILTNGTITIEKDIVSDDRVVFCIPLYGTDSASHDEIVKTKAFVKLLSNLYLLGSLNCRIELRTVLSTFNKNKLLEFSRFVAMNLPFVYRVSFMGIEYVETAMKNIDMLYIDQRDFIEELINSVEYLQACKIDAYVYNFPLCSFPSIFRTYVIDSISMWKKYYPNECTKCSDRNACSGFFRTNYEVSLKKGRKR
jgi:His-Xaa-Ser system radical SAM maturase HxsC